MRLRLGAPQGLNDDDYMARHGNVIPTWAIGRVIESRSERFPIGTYVSDLHGRAGVQDYCVLPASELAAIDPTTVPLTAYLGVLGTQGYTAHLGLLHVGRPVAGETVVVSAAAGSTGSAAGQIAKLKGCRAVGIAGGPEKCRYVVEEFGFNVCVDYKGGDLSAALAAACPNGIDVFFDNVAGQVLDTCLLHMARGGRIVFCGAIAEYNVATPPTGLVNYLQILKRGLRWEAVYYHAHPDKYESVGADLQNWIRAGLLKYREDIVVGLENFYPAFMKLFTGENSGKVVLQVNAGETA